MENRSFQIMNSRLAERLSLSRCHSWTCTQTFPLFDHQRPDCFRSGHSKYHIECKKYSAHQQKCSYNFFLSDIYFSLEVFTLINRALWFLEYQVREGSLLHIRYAGIGDTAYTLFCHIRGMVLQFSFPKLDFDLKYFEIHV